MTALRRVREFTLFAKRFNFVIGQLLLFLLRIIMETWWEDRPAHKRNWINGTSTYADTVLVQNVPHSSQRLAYPRNCMILCGANASVWKITATGINLFLFYYRHPLFLFIDWFAYYSWTTDHYKVFKNDVSYEYILTCLHCETILPYRGCSFLDSNLRNNGHLSKKRCWKTAPPDWMIKTISRSHHSIFF